MKHKHIIIDGPDGCGKTTIVKMLSKKLDIPILKMLSAKSLFNKNVIEIASYTFTQLLIQLKNYEYILDRGFITSLVYSKVYNRKDDLSYLKAVEKQMKPVIIILTATNEELFKRRPVDAIISREQRIKVKDEYDRLAKEQKYNLIDTTGLTRKQVLNKVIQIIETN